LAIARTPEHADFLRQEVTQSRGWGVAVDDLDADQLAARSTLYRPSGAEAAWWCPEDVYVEEPISLVDAYVAACRRHGVEVREHAAVVGMEVSAGRVAAVHTEAERIEAGAVVDAAGAWTQSVAELARAWVGVAAVRHQLLITEPTADVDPGDPIVRVIDSAVYLRPARGGVMLGGFEADPLGVAQAAVAKLDTADLELDLGVLERLAASVAKEAPAADPARSTEHRAGMFTMSPDGRFVVGAVPGVEGLFVAAGCNGSGFSSSLGIGEALAAQVCGLAPFVDLSTFAPSRVPRMTDEGLAAAGAWQYAHYYDPAS
jgi:glycine/D-amino acid oxidase-like deaminating enzyme